MRVREIRGNLLNIDVDAICHQVNCVGKMGAGLALNIRKKNPKIYTCYKTVCDLYKKNPSELLGHVMYFPTEEQLIINIFGQVGIRHSRYDKRVLTDYNALKKAMKQIAKDAINSNIKSIGFPVGMGSNLAGGDWNTIENVIIDSLKDTDLEVVFCKYAK